MAKKITFFLQVTGEREEAGRPPTVAFGTNYEASFDYHRSIHHLLDFDASVYDRRSLLERMLLVDAHQESQLPGLQEVVYATFSCYRYDLVNGNLLAKQNPLWVVGAAIRGGWTYMLRRRNKKEAHRRRWKREQKAPSKNRQK